MTTIYQLQQNILLQGQEEAARIQLATDEKVMEIMQETARLVQEKRNQLYAAAQQEHEEKLMRIQAMQQLTRQQEILVLKQKEIEITFDEATHTLATCSGQTRKRILDNLWKKAQAIDIGMVFVAKKDESFISPRYKKTIIESIGGFIVATKDDTVRLDLTFESLLATIKMKKLSLIAHILFDDTTRPRQRKKTSTKSAKTNNNKKRPHKGNLKILSKKNVHSKKISRMTTASRSTKKVRHG